MGLNGVCVVYIWVLFSKLIYHASFEEIAVDRFKFSYTVHMHIVNSA